ncbi:MAG: hypothetical protein OHK0045_07340 [Raineya sp.]
MLFLRTTLKFFLLHTSIVFAQISPSFPAADTIYIFQIHNNDTSKRVLQSRLFHIYDKYGHIREILWEARQNNAWQYKKRMIFSYNAINRLQAIKYELWDSLNRDWLKFRRRTYNYNVRYLPIEYIDEIWSETQNSYQTLNKTNFNYTKQNKAQQAIYKIFGGGKWTDSLQKNIFYDSSGKIKRIEQRRISKDIRKTQFFWEYKYEGDKLKEILKKDMEESKNKDIISKSVLFYDKNNVYVGKQEQELIAPKKPYKELGGIKSWYNAKKNQWTYSFYIIENGKALIKEQWVICPTTEQVKMPLKDFPFPLLMEW